MQPPSSPVVKRELSVSPSPMESLGNSVFPEGSSPKVNGRRQRISMACQYCRHRSVLILNYGEDDHADSLLIQKENQMLRWLTMSQLLPFRSRV